MAETNRGRKRMAQTERKVAAAFREVRSNPPSTLDPSKTGEEREAQIRGIALSKARQAVARIPENPKRVRRRPRGSGVFTEAEIRQGFRRLG